MGRADNLQFILLAQLFSRQCDSLFLTFRGNEILARRRRARLKPAAGYNPSIANYCVQIRPPSTVNE